MAKAKIKAPKDEGTEVNFDFEDSKPEVFVFLLPDHYANRIVYGNVSCGEDCKFTFHGTREEVAPVGRILTRYYGGKLVKS